MTPPSNAAPIPVVSPPAVPDADLKKTLGLGKNPHTRRWVALALAGAVLASVAGGGAYAYRRAKARAIPGYVTAPATRGDLKVTVTATGNMEAANTVSVGVEISGRITRVLVDFNDEVKQGQLLAEVDPEPWRIRVAEARAQHSAMVANVAQGKAALLEAGQNEARNDELFRRGMVAKQAAEAAHAAAARTRSVLKAARAQVDVAEAGLATAQSNLAKVSVRSPMAGVVLSRNVDPGQTVAAAFQAPVLFTLAQDLTHMKVRVAVDEADVGRVREAQHATFSVDAYPGRTFSAVIEEVHNAPKTVQNVVTYDALLTVDNADKALRPGMTATATISTDTREGVLRVPNTALRFSPPALVATAAQKNTASIRHEEQVWTLRNGTLTAVPVKTGPSDGVNTEIVGGDLAEDTPVVVDVERKAP
jgi:HlyD family secretion protein